MSNLRSYCSRLLFLLVLACKFGVMQGQVLVHEEPRHHVVFQNSDIRMLNVLMAPGDTSQYHIHNTPSVFIFFTNTNIGSQLQGKVAVSSTITEGRILFENLGSPNIRVHRVWNADKDTFHVMDLELLFKDTGFVQKPLNLLHLKLEIDTNWIRAYRLSLLNGDYFALKNKVQSFVLVALNTFEIQIAQGGKSQIQVLRPGSFFTIKQRESFAIKSIGIHPGDFYLLELPGK